MFGINSFNVESYDLRMILVVIPIAAFFLFKRYFSFYGGNRMCRVRIEK